MIKIVPGRHVLYFTIEGQLDSANPAKEAASYFIERKLAF
jgi:hypothetical protein